MTHTHVARLSPVLCRSVSAVLLLASLFAIVGCASYATPGGPANMGLFGASRAQQLALTDPSIQTTLSKQPLAVFPVAMAIAHVQAPGYSAWNCTSYGAGSYSVVTTRRNSDETQFQRLVNLPLVSGVSPMSRLLLPTSLASDKELRQAAASLHADLLFVYTYDTTFRTDDFASPLTLVTLGLFPSKSARVCTTASAVLLDTRNGYVYGTAECTSKPQTQLANSWTSREAVDDARVRAEAEALVGLVDEFERLWGKVLMAQAQRPPSPALITTQQWNGQAVIIDGTNAPQGPTYYTPAR